MADSQRAKTADFLRIFFQCRKKKKTGGKQEEITKSREKDLPKTQREKAKSEGENGRKI